MEKRLSERVQFFQLTHEEDVPPVWVFQRAHPGAILGLLLDISAAGIQILTDKSSPMLDEAYQLIVHVEESASVSFTSVVVRRLWSNPYGALYIRNGFVFAGAKDSASPLSQVLAARAVGQKWLRCELAAI
jgi:hypothetical protein